MDWLRQDLRFAFRTFLKSPTFTAAAVLTLALGIGTTSAMFSVVNGVLLKELPYQSSDRIVVVWGADEWRRARLRRRGELRSATPQAR